MRSKTQLSDSRKKNLKSPYRRHPFACAFSARCMADADFDVRKPPALPWPRGTFHSTRPLGARERRKKRRDADARLLAFITELLSEAP